MHLGTQVAVVGALALLALILLLVPTVLAGASPAVSAAAATSATAPRPRPCWQHELALLQCDGEDGVGAARLLIHARGGCGGEGAGRGGMSEGRGGRPPGHPFWTHAHAQRCCCAMQDAVRRQLPRIHGEVRHAAPTPITCG